MAKISVDHKKLENAAKNVDSYVTKHTSNMRKITTSVKLMSRGWQGEDYHQLQVEWNEIKAKESVSGHMVKALENYSDFLNFAAKKYKDAQVNAVNRANRLPQ